MGNGYGFPSSHSQNMGYFATFLILHLHFRHTFTPSGSWIVDKAIRVFAYFVIVSWAGVVAYSRYGFLSWVTLVLFLTLYRRYHLSYHSVPQILWGMSIGISFGIALYAVTELIPIRRPTSLLGRARSSLLTNPVSVWLRIRDGWATWPDAGWEDQWQRWNREWRRRTKPNLHVN